MSSPLLKQGKRRHEYDEDEASRKRRRSSFGAALSTLLVEREDGGCASENRRRRTTVDRFVAAPVENHCPVNATPRSQRMAKAFGLVGERRIRYTSPPPPPSPTAPLQSLQCIQKHLTRSLYEIPLPLSLTSASTNIQPTPATTLSAPGMVDDFYSRPACWSRNNILAVASRNSVNCRNMENAEVSYVCPLYDDSDRFAQLEWVPDATQLAMGVSQGEVRVMDMHRRLTSLDFVPERFTDDTVGALGWRNTNELIVGYTSGVLRRYDKRVKELPTAVLPAAHRLRVCSVRWNADATLFATGAGDGVVLCWDARHVRKPLARVDQSGSSSSSVSACDGTPDDNAEPTRKWRARKHRSTVKALAWCPWQPDLLATGGGTMDGAIRFWSASTGAPKKKVIFTDSQVSSLHWSLSCKEIVSTHGYGFQRSGAPSRRTHSILVHNYPKGELVGKIFDVCHGRISDSCMSPDGTQIVTCGADETLRVYNIFGPLKQAEEEEDLSSRCPIR